MKQLLIGGLQLIYDTHVNLETPETFRALNLQDCYVHKISNSPAISR